MLSVGITGITHLVFAALCMARARRLADGRRAMTPGKIFGITVAVSCVPFALLYLIPPALVALTGMLILPLLHGMEQVIDRERAEIAGLPRAMVLSRSGGLPPPPPPEIHESF